MSDAPQRGSIVAQVVISDAPQRRSLQAQIEEIKQLIAERRAVSIPRSGFGADRRRAEKEERLLRLQCALETLVKLQRGEVSS